MEALYPNALGLILLLLCFQRQLDKQLLELLIAVVDAELLKAVVLEIFWRAKEGTGERE